MYETLNISDYIYIHIYKQVDSRKKKDNLECMCIFN